MDPALAAALGAVEEDLNADYALDDMSEEMQGMAIRLYSLLTSYMRQRPLKLFRHMKQENGFAAWHSQGRLWWWGHFKHHVGEDGAHYYTP